MARERYFDLVESLRTMADPGPKGRRTLREAYEGVVDALRAAGVRFLLHGAFALAAYGFERATRDVDVLVPAEPSSVRSLYAAMSGLRAAPAPPGPPDSTEAIRRGLPNITFNLAGWPVDFFLDEAFPSLFARSKRRKFGGRIVHVISAKDLIERKSERATLQDLADIERLGAIQKESGPRGRGKRIRHRKRK